MESKYDPDAFFSAERYPLPMKCSECGKTMRPVHKHCTPDMPRTYFCTFCGVGIYEDNPSIKFSKKPTNLEAIRAMNAEEIAELVGRNSLCEHLQEIGWCRERSVCTGCIIDWLGEEAEQ